MRRSSLFFPTIGCEILYKNRIKNSLLTCPNAFFIPKTIHLYENAILHRAKHNKNFPVFRVAIRTFLCGFYITFHEASLKKTQELLVFLSRVMWKIKKIL